MFVGWMAGYAVPHWNGLTNAQRSAWHNLGNTTPVRNYSGNIVALNGWQMHNYVNMWLFVSVTVPFIDDAPADVDPPPVLDLVLDAIQAKSQTADGTTAVAGAGALVLTTPTPADLLVVVLHNFTGGETIDGRRHPIPHVTLIYPSTSGPIDLRTRLGTGGGADPTKPRYGMAPTRPWLHKARLPGRILCVSTTNGGHAFGTLSYRGRPTTLLPRGKH